MTPASAHLKRSLTRKAEYLLRRSALPGRSRLEGEFLEPALRFGRVGLIGGAIRDLAFQRCTSFKSDLDFVVEIHDRQQFEKMIGLWQPERSAFGGYRMTIGQVRIDFWEASDSWAHTQRHVAVGSLDDVRRCTFFNLDAVIFDVAARKLLIDDAVLAAFAARLLDINLRPNPNEDGAAVRALRRMRAFDLTASQKLIEFIAERISASGWASLVTRDAMAYPERPLLESLFKTAPTAQAFTAFMAESVGRLRRPEQAAFEFPQQMQALRAA